MQKISPKTIIIGLTGSFGSGCSTIAEILESKFGFKVFHLSDFIREVAKNREVDVSNRWNLQDIGNDLRKKYGRGFLVEKALEKVADTQGPLVLDGIRNSGEIELLRQNYPNFYLIAVDCSIATRWERLKEKYKGDEERFLREDRRDAEERDEKGREIVYGQQVKRCVEQADIILSNEFTYPNKAEIHRELGSELDRYVKLIKNGVADISPTPEESIMALASLTSLRSPCLSRKVGAVICDKHGNVVSVGYNDVPEGEKSCSKLFGECYKDRKRKEIERALKIFFHRHLKLPKSIKLREYCRAICAERNAIYKCPISDLSEMTLFTTTFPCNECAKAIMQKRMKKVIYIHPYPEPKIGIELEKYVKIEKFEGVKAQAFYKLFSRRPLKIE